MEVTLWVPNFLKVNPNFKVVWSGEVLSSGTLLYPYQSPKLQTLHLTNLQDCPTKVHEVQSLFSRKIRKLQFFKKFVLSPGTHQRYFDLGYPIGARFV